MKEGGNMVKTYLPFRFRYTPIVQTVLIKFTKDPDYLYHSLELQVFDQNGKRYAQVLAWRPDGYKDVYQEAGLSLDQGELNMVVGGRGVGDLQETASFGPTTFEEADGQVRIKFSFTDKNRREIAFSVVEDLEDGVHLSWLPSIGAQWDNPTSVPLFFLYEFDFVKKNGSQLDFTIDGVDHNVDPYAFPKGFQSRLDIEYSLESVMTNFNEAREEALLELDLDESGKASQGDQDYHYQIAGAKPHLEKMVMKEGHHPVAVEFEPAFPDYTEIEESVPQFGQFSIKPSQELGDLTGKYNVVKQENKVIINLAFSEGWNPNQGETYFDLIRQRTTTRLTDWYKSLQCTEIIDLDDMTVSVKWKRVDPDRHQQL